MSGDSRYTSLMAEGITSLIACSKSLMVTISLLSTSGDSFSSSRLSSGNTLLKHFIAASFQSMVDCIWSVCGCNNNDFSPRFKAVHQRQQLRHDSSFYFACNLFAFWSNRVDLVYKYNRWCLFLCFFEYFSQPSF